jgi:ComEC/Rec2-related protein
MKKNISIILVVVLSLFKKPANLLVIVLIVICTLLSFISYNNLNNENFNYNITSYFRVIKENRVQFGQFEYQGLIHGNFWLISSKNRLEVGKAYKGDLNLKSFSIKDNKYDFYFKTLGYKGKTKINSIELVSSCDISCLVFLNTNLIKQKLNAKLLEIACNPVYPHELISSMVSTNEKFDCADVAALASGLVIGSKDGISQGIKSIFQKSGLTHILVFSGFQLIFLIGLLEFLFNKIYLLNRIIRILLCIFLLGFLLIFVGFEPPILRSFLSWAIVEILLYIFGRRLTATRALIYSSFLMIIVNPLYVFNLSFLLSVSASFGQNIVSNSSKQVKQSQHFFFKFINQIQTLLLESLFPILMTLSIVLLFSEVDIIRSLIANSLILILIPVLFTLILLSFIPFLDLFLSPFWITIEYFLLWLVNTISKFNFIKIQNFQYWILIVYILLGLIFIFKKSKKIY